eukprot:TRINITY_DN18653_c0_g2_i1.p1 TRINITY_DN18653_c0_g2~~TRINITY_DN18653_c0_g2_i1.p1  ORF type:complete len:104 (+),score=22.99 TRINITY_DN18653_c0_g2_i1:784-1095(+)
MWEATREKNRQISQQLREVMGKRDDEKPECHTAELERDKALSRHMSMEHKLAECKEQVETAWEFMDDLVHGGVDNSLGKHDVCVNFTGLPVEDDKPTRSMLGL